MGEHVGHAELIDQIGAIAKRGVVKESQIRVARSVCERGDLFMLVDMGGRLVDLDGRMSGNIRELYIVSGVVVRGRAYGTASVSQVLSRQLVINGDNLEIKDEPEQAFLPEALVVPVGHLDDTDPRNSEIFKHLR